MKYLLRHTDLLDGSQLTVTGKTLAENLADVVELDFEKQDVVRPLSNPIKSTGHITILRGNLAPRTCVAKITGKEGMRFEGVAKCFDRQVTLIVIDEPCFMLSTLAWIRSTLHYLRVKSKGAWSSSLGIKALRVLLECQRYVANSLDLTLELINGLIRCSVSTLLCLWYK